MSFLPISILAYALNGGSIIIDKILLNKALPNPFIYTFYISILGLLALFLLPFGVTFQSLPIILAVLSGIFFVFGLLTSFQALIKSEASVVGPVVGALNPVFTLILGSIFLSEMLSSTQTMAFFIIIFGALILTLNQLLANFKFNKQLILMVLSGFCFAISYILLRQSFLTSNFLTGLIFSRVGAGIFVILFLLFPKIRAQIFVSNLSKNHFKNSTTILLFVGQFIGAGSGLLINFAVSLANPALVNALFGVQYLVILGVAIFLAHEHRAKLLGENLQKSVLLQKIVGAGVLSWGVYLLAK